MNTVFDEAVREERPEIDLSALAAAVRPDRLDASVLSVDIGSSGVRVALFDASGNEISGTQISLTHGLIELAQGEDCDAESLLQCVERAIDLAVARAERFTRHIDYVACCCFWHSLQGIDAAGRAVTPLFGWADTRAADAARELKRTQDEVATHQRTGARFHPSYWPAKLIWLKREQPEVFKRAAQWVSFSEFLFGRWFGQSPTSVSMASGTGLLNQHTCEWDQPLIGSIGIGRDQLSEIAKPGMTAQRLNPSYAERWPLLDQAAWFPAIGDGAANNIGAGCSTVDRAALMLGTSGAMRVLFSGAPPNVLPDELFCYRAGHDRVVAGGALSDGGSLQQWMRQNLQVDADQSEVEFAVADMNPDAHGLTVLPFWSGERAPGWAGRVTGSILGLTLRTRPIEILRASMEATCYRFALIAEALSELVPLQAIVATGNALTQSTVWPAMLADALGRPIEVSPVAEPSLRGAALLALEAAGKIDGIETVDLPPGEVFEPEMSRHEIYVRAMRRQQQAYQKLTGDSEIG